MTDKDRIYDRSRWKQMNKDRLNLAKKYGQLTIDHLIAENSSMLIND